VDRAVEVAAFEHVDRRVDGLLGQQHGAEDALLGGDVLGWDSCAGLLFAGVRTGCIEIRNTHRTRTPLHIDHIRCRL
jgi:hypothetical protein